MAGYLPVRQSRAARWSRWFAVLALPVLVVGALGARLGVVPDQAILPVILLGFALALLGTLCAAYALVDIWYSGALGVGQAGMGMLYAFPVLLLLAIVVAALVRYPQLNDISTDPADPPAFRTLAARPQVKPVEERLALQAEAYDDIPTRLYPFPVETVYAAVTELMANRGWTVTFEMPPVVQPEPLAPEPFAPALTTSGGLGPGAGPGGALALAPPLPDDAPPADAPPQTVLVEAVARTLIFRFADAVMVRMETTPAGTRVDMRSASGQGEHDLGQNVRRIRSLLADLDSFLEGVPDAYEGAGPRVTEPVDPVRSEPVQPLSPIDEAPPVEEVDTPAPAAGQ